MGFRQGGTAGCGLRRRLIDQNGIRRTILAFGERKSLQTDRVVLEPGPAEEVETVPRMFGMLVHDNKSPGEIASRLNDEQIRTDLDRAWTSSSVQAVLTNEKYIGNNVFNRVSVKLKQKRVVNSPDMWIRAIAAFPAIVELELFEAAQTALERRNRHLSDRDMLTRLKELYLRQGRLTSIIIDESRGLPNSATSRRHFGSLGHAYRLVGYLPYRASEFTEINRRLRRLNAEVHSGVLSNIQHLGGTVTGTGKNDLIRIDGEFTCSIVIARCTSIRAGGILRWNVRLDTILRPDITVAVRLAPDNQQTMDYYVLPKIDLAASRLRLAERNGVFLDAYRFDTLHRFFQISGRTRLRFVE